MKSKITVIERVLRLLLLLAANEFTRLEIFERLALYYKVDNIAKSRGTSLRRADGMFRCELDIFSFKSIKETLTVSFYYDLLDSQTALMVTTPYLGHLSNYSIHYIQVDDPFRRPVELLLSYSTHKEHYLCCDRQKHSSGPGELPDRRLPGPPHTS